MTLIIWGKGKGGKKTCIIMMELLPTGRRCVLLEAIENLFSIAFARHIMWIIVPMDTTRDDRRRRRGICLLAV